MNLNLQFLPEVSNDTIFALIGGPDLGIIGGQDGPIAVFYSGPSPWLILLGWLAIINVVTFLVFGLDKWKARRKEKKESVRRVPEKTLLLLAALGGSIGALLGMKVWRHKTLHKTFRFGVPLILALQIIIPFGLWLYFGVLR